MTPQTTREHIVIRASAARVWAGITDPVLVKQWLYGTQLASSWKVGEPITYRNEWEGKVFFDKGIIVEVIPHRLLKHTYFSPFSGLEDLSDNYQTITYELAEAQGQTTLTIVHENVRNQTAVDHSEAEGNTILEGLKKLLEA